MKVRIVYSGFLAEIAGKSIEEVEVSEDSTLESLLNHVLSANPRLKEWFERLPLLQVFVNGIEVLDYKRAKLKNNDEVVLSPPLYEGG